jgi:hypothetical protein
MKQDQLITLLLVGVGGYIVWQYILAPMFAAQQPLPAQPQLPPGVLPVGAAVPQPPVIAPVSTGTQTAASAPSTPAVTAAQLNSLAKTMMLNPDQWAYYYQTIPGKVISPQQMESILANLSLTDATRATPVTSTQFVAALNATGLSGVVPAFPAGGGPSFSSFIPGGGSFSGGFSGSNRGFRAAPKAWLQ